MAHSTVKNPLDDSVRGGRLLANPLPGEEIVISGLSGAFPMSGNIYEFRDNLFNKVDMVTETKRWNVKHPEIPSRSGTIINDINKYDIGFFGIHERQGNSQDVLSRLFQEKAIEAIFDAGINPSDLEGTRTGVFVGYSFTESEKVWFYDNLMSQSYAFTGIQRSMIAHRLSYFLKLKGPSFTSDTACSSTLYALEHAYRTLRSGQLDYAIVGGSSLCLHPFVSLQFARLGMLSMDGCCKSFDKSGTGYVRSEGIGAIFLQKSKHAQRIYAQILHAKTNCDGYKEHGITYPSGEAQMALLSDFYEECSIDRYNLSYLEAHGTGTIVGDPEECASIDKVLTKNRKTPLMIGSVKSNIGHTETSSSICSIAKCIIAMETGSIPPNIHYNTPRDELHGIIEGRLKVVSEKMKFEDDRGLIGVNSFGFGGGNCHVLLRWNEKEKINHGIPKDNIPRLVCISGRTEEAVTCLLNELSTNSLDAEYISLLHTLFRKNIQAHLYRGYIIVTKMGEIDRSLRYSAAIDCKTLCVAFGELNNWHIIGRHLMQLPAFSDSIERFQKNVPDKDINILNILLHTLPVSDNDHVIGSLAVQIGILDVLKIMELNWENVGYSLGLLPAAYGDGVLNLIQTISCGIILDTFIKAITDVTKPTLQTNEGIINGNDKRAIVNGNDGLNLMDKLTTLRLIINSNKSKKIKERLFQNLKEVIGTSWNGKSTAKYKSPDDFINILIEDSKCHHLNSNSVIFNVGKTSTYMELDSIDFPSENSENYLTEFLKAIGRLYEYGYNPLVSKLYPAVALPVSRGTRMISPFIKWKYRQVFAPRFNDDKLKETRQGCTKVTIALDDHEWSYIGGHMIDGKYLFPAIGYLYLVWEATSTLKRHGIDLRNASFEHCRFLRATTLPKNGYLIFYVTIHERTGSFEIVESDTPVVTGRIRILENNIENIVDPYVPTGIPESQALPLTTKDIYKELRLRGYHYKEKFRAIQKCDVSASRGFIKWEDNWVTYIDNMLQMKILQTDSRLLCVPTYIENLTVNVNKHLELVKENQSKEDGTSILPVINNQLNGVISSGGVRISGLIASSINRKRNMAIPVLEHYKFIPNYTSLETEESVRVNIQIILENAMVYKVQAVEIVDEFTKSGLPLLAPIINSVIEDQPLIQPLTKILSKTVIDVDIPVEDKKLSSETDCLIVIASNILDRPELLEEAFVCLKDKGYIISRESPQYDIVSCQHPNVTVLTQHKTSSETLLLLQKQNAPKPAKFVRISSSNFSWVPIVQDAIKKGANEDTVLYSHQESTSGILGLVNCLRREPGSTNIKCIFLEDEKFDLVRMQNQLKRNMAMNVCKNGQWGTYRHLLLKELGTVERDHYFASVMVRGDLSSFKWVEGPLRHNMKVPTETELVQVIYAAVNFKDVMTASGKINIDIIIQDRIKQECYLGHEYSGIDANGNRVMGLVSSGALSNMVLADPYLVIKVPDSWSLEEACTVPIVYGTVLYALFSRGQLKRNESILIHSGTGGIGQAAINVALYYGCQVYTTVGTQEKRDYLLKTYPQIKANHIGNSRDESFEQMILKNTNGRGVDVVLNSLAEDKLLASVRCLARGGRFLEIGKFDLANNNYLNLLLLRKEATFDGIMLDYIFNESAEEKRMVMEMLYKCIMAGAVKPIPRTIFKFDEIKQAFKFMTTGKHMGKVLLQMGQPEGEKSAPLVKKMPCVPRYICDPEKTYIIVGGLGGFGLELADWLILRGARKLVLTSRKGISNGYQNQRIRIWRSYGVIINISKANITTEAGCQQLIEESLKLGPIHSIFNLAVILEDGIFENQTPEKFSISFGPKAIATQHLDKLTRCMCPDLRDFVIFSSVSCGRGNAGQTNYGMANSVMERICERRKENGYPALAIQWGAVGEVGLVAEMQENNAILEIGGTLLQQISNCLQVLDTLLTQKEATLVSSMVVAEKRSAFAAENIVGSVLNILGIADKKSVSAHSTLPELGLDSITAVEIKQTLEREHEIYLTPKDLRTMTLARLMELDEKKLQESQPSKAPDVDGFGFEMVFKLIGEESESCLPYIRLQSKSDGKHLPNVFLFPGIEGSAKVFQYFTAYLNAQITCMQYACNSEDETIKDMAESIIPFMEDQLSNGEPFTIVAYSYGTLIALESLGILESHGYIGSIICIDGSPLLMKEMSKNLHTLSKQSFETILVCQLISCGVSSEIIAKNQENIFKCATWEERLDLGFEIANQHVASTDTETTYYKKMSNAIYRRINTLIDYSPSYSKLKSDIKLFKPTEIQTHIIAEDYGLSGVFENPVDVQIFEGTHFSVMENNLMISAIDSFVALTKKEK